MKQKSSILIETIKNYIFSSAPVSALTEHELELCTQYGLGPVLADIYLNNEEFLSTDLLAKLRSIKITAQFQSAQFNSAITELLNYINTSETIVILLKGIHFSTSYYKEASHRRMGDIDILVEQKYTDIVTQVLLSLGYVYDQNDPDEFFLTHHHLKPLYHPEKNTWIEVHTRLFTQKSLPGKRKLFQPQHLFKNISPIKKCADNIYGLTVELNLHYTITHWVKEFNLANSLSQIVDIVLLINKNQLDWDKFVNGIESPSHATEIKIIFDLLINSHLIQVPEPVQKAIFAQKDSAGFIGRWILRKIVNGFLNQNIFVSKTIGPTNCERIWSVYLSDDRSVKNHYQAFTALLIADVPGSKSKLQSMRIRLKRLYSRFMNHNDHG